MMQDNIDIDVSAIMSGEGFYYANGRGYQEIFTRREWENDLNQI